MADDSPGKVQALRALFLEKNGPVMGVMPVGGKLPTRPWKNSSSNSDEKVVLKERSYSDQIITTQNLNKVLPYSMKKADLSSTDKGDVKNVINGVSVKSNFKIPVKPNVGPKPSYLLQHGRTNSSNTLNSVSSDSNDSMSGNENIHVNTSGQNDFQKSQIKSKAVADAIATFMFSSGDKIANATALTEISSRIESNVNIIQPLIQKSQSPELQLTVSVQEDNSNAQRNRIHPEKDFGESCPNLITSDNYISKRNCYFRRKTLPPKENLGSAPLKPFKPPNLKLPSNRHFDLEPNNNSLVHKPSLPVSNAAPELPQKPSLQRPPYPCPPRPLTSPPLPPNISTPVIKPIDQRRSPITSLREEIEELYEDTLLQDPNLRPTSLIPEYTEEEERGEVDLEELYNDAEVPILPAKSTLLKPKDPPPPRPSEYLQPKIHHSSVEELYQDALEPDQDQFYEEMPIDLTQEDSGAPLYSNNRKEIEKLKKEEEKRLKKEQKEKEKKERESEKIKKKFGLLGNEVPIDAGLVKADCRGGKGDLSVKRGETVLILRMEGNPSGRWLVKNEKGKIGYVELTNIEVDPDSVKSQLCHSYPVPLLSEDDPSTNTERNLRWLSKFTACVR